MLSYKNQNDCYSIVSFEEVYNLYVFDMKLRNLLLPILECVEIAFRTHISYYLAHTYGALGYKISKNFKNKEYHKKMKETFLLEIKRSDEIFVAHHKKHYGGNFPIWVLIEIISFGTLSKLFNNLQEHDKDNIGYEHYEVKGEYIRTWLHSLSNIRNKCAHYGRLYNTSLTITPKLFKSDRKKGLKNNTVFANIYIMSKLINDKKEWNQFVNNLSKIIESCKTVNLNCIGFPENWKELLIKT